MTTTTVQQKNVVFKIKAVGEPDGLENGSFQGYASVFDNRDSYGDVVRKGAFTATLDAWEQSDQNIPVYYGHRLDDPMMNIGQLTSAVEDDHGLLVDGQIDLDTPTGAQVYRLMKGRRLSAMSYSYAVTDGSFVAAKADGDGDGDGDGGDGSDEVFEIRACDLYEVSVVPVGANPEAEILSVKSGRVLSQKNLEALRSARDAISAVIKDAESTSDSDQGKASASGSAKGEPRQGKPEEPDRKSPANEPVASSPTITPNAVLSALAIFDVERSAK